MKTLIDLSVRHWMGICIIVALTTISTLAFGSIFNQNAYGTTVFLNIGAISGPAISPLDTVQAADSFTETVMGWFKNPDFLGKISEESGFSADPVARKQEKQNLIVTYKTQNPDQAQKVFRAVVAGLQSEIKTYDSSTGSGFVLTSSSENTSEIKIHLALFGLAGLIFGLMLGFALMAVLDRIMKEINEYRH